MRLWLAPSSVAPALLAVSASTPHTRPSCPYPAWRPPAWRQYCAEDAAHVEQAVCFAYILGIADLLAGYDVFGFRVCFPEEVDLKLMVATTEKYLFAHPERLHYTPGKLVLDALADAFPCR